MSIFTLVNNQALFYFFVGVCFIGGLITTATVSYQLGSVETLDESVPTTTPTFLKETEVLIIKSTLDTDTPLVLPIDETLFEYVEVTDGCDIHFEGECLLVRSGPGTDFEPVARLRNDMVLKVDGSVTREGVVWYKVVFDEWLRYPERVESDWYVAADYVAVLYDEGDKTIWDTEYATSTKQIVVDLSDQTLTATENGEVYMCVDVSTGLELTPTPLGTFTIFKKTPSRYMQGPLPGLPSDQSYDLPGVPWNLYFTQGGAVIHGTYWHDSFGATYSHGCVNLLPEEARKLYQWADLGVEVKVQK